MGTFSLTPYQTKFRDKLDGDHAESFDALLEIAKGAKKVEDMLKELPDDFAKVLDGENSVSNAFDKILRASEWPETYSPPAATAPKAKGPALKSESKKAEATTTPTKRRGNPDALAKARAERGLRTAEQSAQDKDLVIKETVAYLKKNKGIQPIKGLVASLVEALQGKSANGANVTENFVYSTITKHGREDGSPFECVSMEEGRKKGYQLRG